MTAIDFRNNINWAWGAVAYPVLPPSQKPKNHEKEDLVALIQQQSFVNALPDNPSGVLVRLTDPDEIEQALSRRQDNRPAPNPTYYTRVLDDNLAVRKDKLASHPADMLNQRTSMVSVSGSYSEAELTAMMDATAKQQPDISNIMDLMQPLQNGELNSTFSSRVNIGLPNTTEKVINMDTLEAVYNMSYRNSGTHIENTYQANMSLTLITEDNTKITINAELMNKLVLDEDYVMFGHSSRQNPYFLVGASRDLNLSFSANQELTDKDKELMSNIGSVVGNLLNGFYQNLSVDSEDTQALLSLQNNGVENVDLKLSTNDRSYYYLSDEYFNGIAGKIYFNLSKIGEGEALTANNSHKANSQTVQKMQDYSKYFN